MPREGKAQKRKVEEKDDDNEAESAAPASSSRGKKAKASADEDMPKFDDDDDEDYEDDDDEEIIVDGEEPEEEEEGVKHIWRPGVDELQEGEQLDVEPGTYDMLHRAQVEWPCLSFDIIRDNLGAQRTAYPMTAYVVAGSQASRVEDNRLYVMKWWKLHRTSKDGREDDSDEDEDSDDDEEETEAVLDCKSVPHPGGVNRVRSMPQAGHIVATWSDTGKVHMWNLEAQRKAVDKPSEKAPISSKPIFTSEAHKDEGFALDFSPHDTGRFLTGGNDSAVFLLEPVPGGWSIGSDKPFSGHSAAVEDVQWKKTGAGSQHIFASCSADKSVRIWDVREPSRKKSAATIANAHGSDVNVLSWSPVVGELIVTGADDGGFKVWDTRQVSAGAMANFQWHKKPITSVDWHPSDETVLAVASDDDCVSLWDMAVEDDTGGADLPPGAEHFPAQLLFLHQGQKEVKELRWHPQIPSVCITTAGSGFNIFKTCNI